MPTWLPMVMLFAFGAAIGSFLNVCIYRLPVGQSLIWPPSHCPGCFAPVGADNIPIIGYLIVGGHCRHCGVKLSLQYPLVELLSAVLLPLGYWHWVINRGLPAGLFGVYAFVVLTMIVVTFIDLRWRIIPDRVTVLLIACGPVISLLYPRLMRTTLADFVRWKELPVAGGTLTWLVQHERIGALAASLLGVLMGTAVIFVVRTLGTFIFRKEAMGLGDMKLLAGVGGLLGWKAIPLVFLCAVVAGAVIGIAVYLRSRRHDIPFGPYLALGSVVVMFVGNALWKWYLGLMYLAGSDILN